MKETDNPGAAWVVGGERDLQPAAVPVRAVARAKALALVDGVAVAVAVADKTQPQFHQMNEKSTPQGVLFL